MRGYAQTTLGQVHYRHAGDRGPAVVCFHEAPMSSEIYAPAIPVLARSFRAYAFDTPGHGFSDPFPKQPSIEQYATTLLEAIDDIGIGDFILVGCHTGAAISLDIARQAGRRVTHAVLTGVPMMKPDEWEGYFQRVLSAGRTDEPPPKSWKDAFAPDFEPTMDGAHMRWAWNRWASGKRKDYPLDRTPVELINMAVIQLLLAGPHYNWMYRAAWAYDTEPALRSLSCPVLLLNGSEDVLADKDAAVAELISDARIVHLEGLTGQLPWRVPGQFTVEIEKFVGANISAPA